MEELRKKLAEANGRRQMAEEVLNSLLRFRLPGVWQAGLEKEIAQAISSLSIAWEAEDEAFHWYSACGREQYERDHFVWPS